MNTPPYARSRKDRPWFSRLLIGIFSCAVPIAAQNTSTQPAETAPAPRAAVPVPQTTIPGSFADNPIVYFVMTDRFFNGDPSNDNSYGRRRESDPQADVGTFHGGDLKGITKKLQEGYFKRLGVNALWITAPYEQIHGWVVGGNKEFKHYAYHGYYAADFTVLDKNMGTPSDLSELISVAHAQGIRILFDVVMNHPGYLDIQSAQDFKIQVLWPYSEKATLRTYHNYIDYNSDNWDAWWGRDWVRAGLPGYMDGGRDDITMQLAYLPDFRTESKGFVKLPKFLAGKADTRATDLPDTTVRGYLVKWLTDWVREYGVDGFRVDTVKHVEPAAWTALKVASMAALADWKRKNPAKRIDDAPFWMVGEYWGAGPERHKMHDFGFDAMINFDFQERSLTDSKLEGVFEEYAAIQADKPAQMLNYLSSHDTKLYDRGKLLEGGSALLLAPGGVQIFYGDETARPMGPMPNTDPQQATRSDMNWGSIDEKILAHWQRLGSFRARHVALARGAHHLIAKTPYVFSRIDAATDDRVVVAMDVLGKISIPVGDVFPEGQPLRDAYTGRSVIVTGGKVDLVAARYVLLERLPSVGM